MVGICDPKSQQHWDRGKVANLVQTPGGGGGGGGAAAAAAAAAAPPPPPHFSARIIITLQNVAIPHQAENHVFTTTAI
jgi:hypothetical protein